MPIETHLNRNSTATDTPALTIVRYMTSDTHTRGTVPHQNAHTVLILSAEQASHALYIKY